MKKKKVFLGGLLGISIIAAGITLASCKSIPLTPYESSKTAVPTPTPTSGETPQESTTTPAQDPTTGTTPATTPSEGTGTQTSSTDVAPTAFTITYNANGHGENLPEAVIGATALPATLPTMSADGYTFVGWATTATATESDVTAGQAITADVTLYAIWEEEADNYVVVANFDATELTTGDTYVEGQTTDTTEEKADVTSAELCDGFFTKVGTIKKRSKQYKDASDTKQYSSECVSIEANKDSGLTFTVTRNSKVVLSLQSTSSSNKSVFTLNDSSDNAVAASNASSLTQNETANHYVITGSAVEVKYELEAGTYKMLFVDEKAAASDSSSVNRGGRFFSILVKSEPVATYTVTYNANGHGENLPEAVLGATTLPATLPTMTADGYNFVGWATTATATESDVTAGQALSSDVTLYAIWVDANVTFTVTYDTNGHGEAQDAVSDVTALPATLPTLTAEGYDFLGWATTATATEPNVTAGQAIAKDTVLYAVWVQKFTVTFDLNYDGHPGNPANQVVRNNTTVTAPTVEDRVGYLFEGWTDADGNAVDLANPVTSNLDLKAKWVLDTSSYGVLSRADGVIIATKFKNDQVKTTYQGFQPDDKGFYNANVKEGCTVEVTNGKLVLSDTSTEEATIAVAEIGFHFTGVIDGTLKYTPTRNDGKTDANGSWSMITFMGYTGFGSEEELFALRTNSDKKIQLYIGSTFYGTAFTYSSGTEYLIDWEYNFANSTLSVSINGTVVVENQAIPAAKSPVFLTALKFMTSKDASRGAKIGDFAVAQTENVTLDDEKNALKAILTAYYTNLDVEHKYTINGAALTTLYNNVNDAIDAATTRIEAITAFAQFSAYKIINDDDTQNLINARTAATTEVGSYLTSKKDNNEMDMFCEVGFSYTESGKLIELNYDGLPALLSSALNAATTVDEITNATTGIVVTFKAKIDTLCDDSNAMFAYYKDKKKESITTYYVSTDYTLNKTAYDAVIDALDNATTEAGIKDAYDDAYGKLSDSTNANYIKNDTEQFDYQKTTLTTNLSTYRDNEISNLEASAQETIANLKTNGIVDIEDITEISDYANLQSVYDTVTGNIDIVFAESNIDTLKTTYFGDNGNGGTLKTYKDSAISANALDSTLDAQLISDINAVTVTDYDTTYTANSQISDLKAAYNDALISIDNLIIADAKIKAKSAVSAYVTTQKATLLYTDTNSKYYVGTDANDFIGINTTETAILNEIDDVEARTTSNTVTVLSAKTAIATIVNAAIVSTTDPEYTCDVDVVIAAIKAATEVTVTLYVNGGTLAQNVESQFNVILNSNLQEFAAPTRTEYVFEGWFTTSTLDDGSKYTFGNEITGNIELYAKWSLSRCLYYFGTEAATGGTVLKQSSAESNGLVSYGAGLSADSSSTTIDGVTFAKYIGSSGGLKNSNRDRYVLIDMTNVDVNYKVRVYYQGNNTNRYLFVINNVDKDGIIKTVSDEGTKTSAYFYIDVEDLDAHYVDIILEHNKKYYIGGSNGIRFFGVEIDYRSYNEITTYDGTNKLSNISVLSGETPIITGDNKTIAEPVKTGYTFVGWYTDSSLDAQYEYIPAALSSNITLYAKFEVNHYNVAFDKNYQDAGTILENVEYNHKVTPPTPVRSGYVLTGWATRTGEPGNYVYTPFDFDTPITEEVTLYAQWAEAVTVTFDANGGDLGSIESSKTIAANSVISNPGEPTFADHTFDGWYAGTDADHLEATPFDFDAPVTGTVTLYAKWISGTAFAVTFDSVGGTDIPTQNIVSGQTATEPANAPTKEHFTFEGWYAGTDADNLEATAFNFTTEITGPITLYAKWTEDAHFTVTFNSNGGSSVDSQKLYTGSDPVYATEPTSPTKAGLTFVGWFTSSDNGETLSTTAYEFDSEVVGDITLYAKWTLILNSTNWTATSGTNNAKLVKDNDFIGITVGKFAAIEEPNNCGETGGKMDNGKTLSIVNKTESSMNIVVRLYVNSTGKTHSTSKDDVIDTSEKGFVTLSVTLAANETYNINSNGGLYFMSLVTDFPENFVNYLNIE